jgi:hypothetical protein
LQCEQYCADTDSLLSSSHKSQCRGLPCCRLAMSMCASTIQFVCSDSVAALSPTFKKSIGHIRFGRLSMHCLHMLCRHGAIFGVRGPFVANKSWHTAHCSTCWRAWAARCRSPYCICRWYSLRVPPPDTPDHVDGERAGSARAERAPGDGEASPRTPAMCSAASSAVPTCIPFCTSEDATCILTASGAATVAAGEKGGVWEGSFPDDPDELVLTIETSWPGLPWPATLCVFGTFTTLRPAMSVAGNAGDAGDAKPEARCGEEASGSRAPPSCSTIGPMPVGFGDAGFFENMPIDLAMLFILRPARAGSACGSRSRAHAVRDRRSSCCAHTHTLLARLLQTPQQLFEHSPCSPANLRARACAGLSSRESACVSAPCHTPSTLCPLGQVGRAQLRTTPA